MLGEGLIDKNTLLSNPIYKSKKPGFFYMAHKMSPGQDIKNFWDILRGYDIPFTENWSKKLTLKDRFLLGLNWSSPMKIFRNNKYFYSRVFESWNNRQE